MLVGEIINLQPDLTSNLSQGTNSMQNMATLAVLVRFTRVRKVALAGGGSGYFYQGGRALSF